MFASLPTASLSVADLLAGTFRFAIPPYQRSYSWTRDEAGRLLDDLTGAAGLGAPGTAEPDYFLGTVLLMDHSGRGRWPAEGSPFADDTVVDIVDGQQRIVTLSILAAVLRDLESGAENEEWTRLDVLLAIAGSGRPGGGDRRFRLILSGRDRPFFERYVLSPGAATEMPGSEDEEGAGSRALIEVREHFLAELAGHSAEERRVLARYLRDQTHVVAIMTSDVDRAHRLFSVLNDRGRPLLKSDILKAEVLSSLPVERSPAVLAAWDEASRALGDGFDRFFGHLKVLHDVGRPQIINAVREIVADAGGAEPFVHKTLLPLARIYRSMMDAAAGSSGLPAEIERHLRYLGRLNGEDWVPAAMAALVRREEGDPAAGALLAEIDRQAHLMRILTLGADKRARRFAAITAAIRSRQARDTTHPVFEWTRDELRPLNFNLQTLWRKNPSICKLLLLRIADEIGGRALPADPAELSVEHVLPQRPPTSSEWRRLYPNADEREALTQSLGNLVLLPHRLNEAARNKNFAEKRVILGRHNGGGAHLPLLDDVLAAPVWGPAQVRAREARLLKIVGRLLRLEVNSSALVR